MQPATKIASASCPSRTARLIIDRATRCICSARISSPAARDNLYATGSPQAENAVGTYLRGPPRYTKINYVGSAPKQARQFERLITSEPGGIRRAGSRAAAARISQSSLSGERCVSLLIAPMLPGLVNILRYHTLSYELPYSMQELSPPLSQERRSRAHLFFGSSP